MENTLTDQRFAEGRLRKNCLKIILHLSLDERMPFYRYLFLTFDYGITHGVENAYIVRTGDFRFLEHTIGDKSKIDMEEAVKLMASEPEKTLFLFHNHPNSTAPSYDDLKIFLPCLAVKNMIVCGHSGNLYFIQKGNLFYEETENKIKELIELLKNMPSKILRNYLDTNGYTEKEMSAASEEIQLKCVSAVMGEFIDNVYDKVKKYGFKCYTI